MAETAFAVLVPEAEPYVGELRARYDPSAALGAAAHITVLYPFMPPEMITAQVRAKVQEVVSATRSFAFALRAIQRFPGVLYLEPEPAQPLVALTLGLVSRFPSFPAYGGKHADVRPHLTIAQAGEADLAAAEHGLRRVLPPAGVSSLCRELALMENASGRWRQMDSFVLLP
jgi:2'-5' RNA ligase